MCTLILDTSTERGFVARATGEKIEAFHLLSRGLRNSKELMPAIDEIMKGEELTLLVAGVGPGSYTGMRVTAAVAKMIAFTKNIPLVAVSSLLAYYPENEGRFFSLFDARISGVYLIEGEKKGGTINWKEAENVPFEEVSKRVGTALLFSPHEKLKERLSLPLEIVEPKAEEMLRIALQKDPVDPANLPLLYLREHPASGTG